jgi:hypothetical protein
VDTTGYVWSWGDGSQGQIGDGQLHPINSWITTPYKITVDNNGQPFTNIVSIVSYFAGNYAQGYYALKSDGTLWVWGATTCGMKGDGTLGDSTKRPVQVPVPGGRKVVQTVAGAELIVLCSDGTVWTCGGNNGNAQNLGYAATGTNYLSLHQLTGLSNIAQIAGGMSWNYALAQDGTLYGWGYYGSYMGGAGPLGGTPIATPTVLTAISSRLQQPISSIVTNSNATYVILKDGTLWSWGDNAQGAIGNGQELNYMTTASPFAWDFKAGDLLQQYPVRITNRSDFTHIFGSSVFTFYAYAVTADNTLYSWGRNKGGVIGNGIMSCSSQVSSTYPNSWDVPLATIVDPLALKKATPAACPYCLLNPSGTPCNACSAGLVPAANAGTNIAITLPATSVNLNGGASTNPGGGTLTYAWSYVGGPSQYALATPTGVTTGVTGLAEGTYQFSLKVTNSQGYVSADTVSVVVNAAPLAEPFIHSSKIAVFTSETENQKTTNIFPATTNDYLSITSSITEAVKIELLNMNGDTLQQYEVVPTSYRLDMRTLSAGVYKVVISNDNSGIIHRQIIIRL